MPENILVAGGTGLVGSELLRALSERQNVTVTALVRRVPESSAQFSQINYQKFNFDDPSDYVALNEQTFSAVFLCMETTRKKAGSAAAFAKVDLEYPKKIMEADLKKDLGSISNIERQTNEKDNAPYKKPEGSIKHFVRLPNENHNHINIDNNIDINLNGKIVCYRIEKIKQKIKKENIKT